MPDRETPRAPRGWGVSLLVGDRPPPGSVKDPDDGKPRRSAPRFVLDLITLAIVPLACGPSESLKPVFPARGQVFLEGKPAAGVLVVLHPIGDPTPNALDPRAVVEGDGTFVISTHYANDGAPPGQYAVTVHSLKSGPDSGGAPAAPGGDSIPARYADRRQSRLEAEILDRPNIIPPFRLTR